MTDGASQPGHGFTRGRAVRFDGTRWVAAAPGDAGIRVVSAFVDADSFELAAPGEVLDGFDDLEPGATYYLTAAGGMSTTISATKLGTAYSTQQIAVEIADVTTGTTSEFPAGAATQEALLALSQLFALHQQHRTDAQNDVRYVRLDAGVVWDADAGAPVVTITGDTVEQVGVPP